MKKKIILVLCILLIFNIHSFGQHNFKQGYYITYSNDTIHGLIDYRGDIRNSKKCVFKKNKKDDVTEFEPQDIKGYRFTNSKFYISKYVRLNSVEKLIFAEFLLDGISNLYYYRDNFGTEHYFIEDKDKKMYELTNEQKIEYIKDKGEVLIESKKYIGYLKAVYGDCPEIQSQINETQFTHKSLIDISKKYHDYVCDGEKCIIYEKKLPPVSIKAAPIFGSEISVLELTENSNYASYQADYSHNLFFGILVQIATPRINEKIGLQAEITYQQSDYYASKFSDGIVKKFDEIYFNADLIQSSAALNYTFPKWKIKPTCALGAVYSYFMNTTLRFRYESEYDGIISIYEESKTDVVRSSHVGAFAQFGIDIDLTKKYVLFMHVKYMYTYGDNEFLRVIKRYNGSVGIYF